MTNFLGFIAASVFSVLLLLVIIITASALFSFVIDVFTEYRDKK